MLTYAASSRRRQPHTLHSAPGRMLTYAHICSLMLTYAASSLQKPAPHSALSSTLLSQPSHASASTLNRQCKMSKFYSGKNEFAAASSTYADVCCILQVRMLTYGGKNEFASALRTSLLSLSLVFLSPSLPPLPPLSLSLALSLSRSLSLCAHVLMRVRACMRF